MGADDPVATKFRLTTQYLDNSLGGSDNRACGSTSGSSADVRKLDNRSWVHSLKARCMRQLSKAGDSTRSTHPNTTRLHTCGRLHRRCDRLKLGPPIDYQHAPPPPSRQCQSRRGNPIHYHIHPGQRPHTSDPFAHPHQSQEHLRLTSSSRMGTRSLLPARLSLPSDL